MTKSPWSPIENDAIVSTYFSMLIDDIRGDHYSKSGHNKELQSRIDRSRGSIEYKNQNISAVLMSLGHPWIGGYKPAFNFQMTLVDAVERWLSGHPNWLELRSRKVAEVSDQVLRDRGMLWIAAPPTLQNAPPPAHFDLAKAVAQKFDAAGRDERNSALGKAGEKRVLHHERASLAQAGRQDLSERVRWISEECGDGAGYDIASFTPDGRDRLVEVKTTNGWERTPFYISRREIDVAEACKESWSLMRLWNFAREPRAFEIRPPLEAHVALTPTSFQADFHRA